MCQSVVFVCALGALLESVCVISDIFKSTKCLLKAEKSLSAFLCGYEMLLIGTKCCEV